MENKLHSLLYLFLSMLFFICCPASRSSLRKIITYFGPLLYHIEFMERFYVEITAGVLNCHILQLTFQMSVWM